MADRRDYYDVLGVSRGADPKEIQRAYRKLARTYHPDVNKDPSADLLFREISEAYDVLSDPETRKRYDTFGHDFRRVPEDVDAETWARAAAGAGGRAPFQGGYQGPYQQGGPFAGGDATWFSADDVDLDDLLGGMFGGRGRRGRGPVPGADQEFEIELPVEDAYAGTKRGFSISGPDGTRNVDVTIPAGVTDGQRIRLAGQGGQGYGGGPRGDLYLIVRLAPNATYRVDGKDIYVRLPVTAPVAALGGQVACDTPGGRTTVKVPPLSSSGRKLRLRGRGMPSRSGAPGDLYAEVSIVMPGSISDEERDLYARLAAMSTPDQRSAS